MRAREGGKVWEKKEYFTPLVTTAGINPKYWMHWHQTQPPFDFTVIRLEALFPIYKLLHKLSLWTSATFSWKKKKIFASLLPLPLLFLPFSSDIFEEQRKGKGNHETPLFVFEANRHRNETQRFWSGMNESGLYCFCFSPTVKKHTLRSVLPPTRSHSVVEHRHVLQTKYNVPSETNLKVDISKAVSTFVVIAGPFLY